MKNKVVIAISGEIASGKTTLAEGLEVPIVNTSKYIQGNTRSEKQAHGDKLDADSDFSWVAKLVHPLIAHGDGVVAVDAVRRIEQVERMRSAWNGAARVLHVHLEANGEILANRFAARGEQLTVPYAAIKSQATEAQVQNLRSVADLVIDTSRCEMQDVVMRVKAMYKQTRMRRCVDVLVGAQYGSEGKGHVVSHIAPEYDVLVRVGGPNAGHTVLTPGDKSEPKSFYHLPSGSLHSPAAKLVLGPGAVINPNVLVKEANNCLGGLSSLEGRLFIDPQANLISTTDIEAEGRLVKKIGSTGQGVGYATSAKIMQRAGGRSLAKDHPLLKPFIRPTLDILEQAYQDEAKILLEGTQGTGLSLHHGNYPYVTSRDTTVSTTAGEAGIPSTRIRKSIVVLRTNPIRVQSPEGGTSGPMGREITWEEVSKRAGVPASVLREREKTTTTKRQRRVAEFNWGDLRRAVMLNGPTDIALTFVDYLSHRNQAARRYEQLTEETLRFVEEVERFSGVPVSLITTRFHRRSIIDRRSW